MTFQKCIKSLMNNKSCSNDKIINEFIKNTSKVMMPIYVLFFNLRYRLFARLVVEGVIRPIYKHKGDPSKPENYRPITILSCLGKLFTSVLNARLHRFLEINDILEEHVLGQAIPQQITFLFYNLLLNCLWLRKQNSFVSLLILARPLIPFGGWYHSMENHHFFFKVIEV